MTRATKRWTVITGQLFVNAGDKSVDDKPSWFRHGELIFCA